MRTYEGVFIFGDTLREEELTKEVERVSSEITRFGGTVKGALPMGRKSFARPIRKRESGQYVRVTFLLEPDQIAPLRARYRINEALIRAQIINIEDSVASAAEEVNG